MTFADKIIAFNQSLRFEKTLPGHIRVMNPFSVDSGSFEASSRFYRKFYSDDHQRKLILGINPGRHGAGVTGVPFTDTKRLKEKCGIEITGLSTHEVSSVFVYDFIEAYGGPAEFYRDFYISAVCPLGFVKAGSDGREVNLNYYDVPELMEITRDFITRSLEFQLSFGIDRDTCYCFGNNKNFRYLSELNREHNYFTRILPLEHPRFIMQYRSRQKELYILKYLEVLKNRS